MNVFATHVSRCRWRSLSLGRPLATQRLHLLRALSSGSEGKKDEQNPPQSNFEEPLDDQTKTKPSSATGSNGWTRRDNRTHPVKAYPDVGARIPLKESQPRVNLSNLMKLLSEQPRGVSGAGGDNNAMKSAATGGEDGQFNVGAEQRSEDAGVDQELSISAFSELLNKSKKADVSVVGGDRGTSHKHSLTREESKTTSTVKGVSSEKDNNIAAGEIGIKDVKGADRFGQPPQFEDDVELDNRVKNILSELKVESSNKGLARGIVGAVRNWGKSHPRHREDLVQEYMSQEREFYDDPPAIVDFTSSSRLNLFNTEFQKAPTEEAGDHKPFLMELDKGDKIQQLVLADARRNDFEELITISHRQWQFPVDNEVCKVDEADVGFEEHTFLQYLLDDFPETGPVRRFMELVINGLEQNPHMSVKEKRDQVFWFKNYLSSFSEEELNF